MAKAQGLEQILFPEGTCRFLRLKVGDLDSEVVENL